MVQYRPQLTSRLKVALAARQSLFDDGHEGALRLFNGFYEGWPDLVFDLYGRTLVIHNYAENLLLGEDAARRGLGYLSDELPWLTCVILKNRRAETAEARNGLIIYGEKPDRSIREYGVRYALDLQLNRDASFYFDTRLLRRWLLDHAAGQSVLNTFAYTSSLGVAAATGGAARVVHTDLNKRFLNVAKDSYSLNALPIHKSDFQSGDFWSHMSRLKRAGEQFDIGILDPPFFSTTEKGTVDLAQNYARLINKLRPLIKSGGRLIAINNALFVSGAEFMGLLEEVGRGEYVKIEALLPVPEDISGFGGTIIDQPPVDPRPFNHPTKIAVLRVWHK
jgi:23S rRNA (cytosine1962-C5)-methyltransferase